MNRTDDIPLFDEGFWDSPYSKMTQIIVWFIVIILSLETIVGNAMVVFAYKIERNISKQVSNRYIVSLAVSDLIIGIEGFPLFTVYVLNGDRWPLGSVACETWLFLDYTLCLVSILTVLLITADRYLSVCHTAKYLKWQSPTKTQMTIFLSWFIPAAVFGFMIYGWRAITGEADSMRGAQCSAPFLANPYVNMGMYVAYYWTTLVAMLILYKGIHQAAKNLEEKAKAKERRHIALILSQRLGTQVGVSLMLHQEKEREKRAAAEKEEATKDSAYGTQTTVAVSTAHPTEESDTNLHRIEEESVNNGGTTLKPEIGRKEEQDDEYECNTEDEQDSLLGDLESVPSQKGKRNRSSVRSTMSVPSLSRACPHSERNYDNEERRDSLSKQFNDEDLSSVLRFKPTFTHSDSMNDSESASAIIQQPVRRFHKHTGSLQNRATRNSGAARRIEQLKRQESTVELEVHESTSSESSPEILRVPQRDSTKSTEREKWVKSMRRRITQAIYTRRISTIVRQRSNSESSTSSSGENEEESIRKAVPQVTITEMESEPKHLMAVATQRTQSLLTPQSGVRKVSTFSTVARERMINSIFSPVSFFSRSRKQTKAERRAHKAFRTITFIVGCFAILWSPYYVMATIYGFCKGECIPSLIYTLSYYMCYLNSSGNPFAYALANRQFRSAFLRMLRGDFNKHR